MKPITHQLCHDLEEHFWRIARSNRQKGIHQTKMEICHILASVPAPRFYTSLRGAYLALWHHRQGKHLRGRHLSMVLEIEHRLSQGYSLADILEQPAPSYYLSPSRIYKLLYELHRSE